MSARPAGGPGIAAVLLAAAFLLFQAATLDYGTTINDLPHVKGYDHSGRAMEDTALSRDLVIVRERKAEDLDRWMLRFKLYSVEADEMLNIMALARVKQDPGSLDPGYYQYGGAYLYPLGAWLLALDKTGVIEVSGLQELLRNPAAMDGIYYWGRMFVLAAFTLSGLALFALLRTALPPWPALLGMALYYLMPGSIMFSQVMKPHWYSLLWINLALYVLARGFATGRLSRAGEAGLGACLGLAVGSMAMNGLFSVLAWGALAVGWRRGVHGPGPLWRVPLAALAVFALANSALLLHFGAYQREAASIAGWFQAGATPGGILDFYAKALPHGLGLAFMALLGLAWAGQAVRPTFPGARAMALAMAAATLAMAVVTSPLSFWHINFRYVPWLLPTAILFLAFSLRPFRRRAAILAVALALTAAQSAPLKLAYWDENDPARSTRLASAAWIQEHVPPGSGLCMDSPAPYNTPPVDYPAYRVNPPDCGWLAQADRQADHVPPHPGFELAARFTPRFSPRAFPLVFSHVNPQISIYKRSP